MWRQNYIPLADSLGWSALVAALPVFALLYLIGVRRKPAWIAALARDGVGGETGRLPLKVAGFRSLAF